MSASAIGDKPYIDLGPSDNVAWDQPRVAVEFIAGEQVNVTPASLLFTDQNWDTPQTLTVSAIDDHDVEGSHSFTVKHTASSADTDFSGQTLTLTVGIRDNDGGGSGFGASGVSGSATHFQITQTAGATEVAEGKLDVGGTGITDTYTVVLTQQPDADKPVTITLFDDQHPDLEALGPSMFNSWLLDTGANSVLVFATAVADMTGFENEGEYEEFGVAGSQYFDISHPYRFDVAGSTGNRNPVRDTRVLSDPDNDISIAGPYGIVGMPAMEGRVTTLDMTVWTTVEEEFLMRTLLGDSVPDPVPVEVEPGVFEDAGRFTVQAHTNVSFLPDGHVVEGEYPPVWSHIPFVTGIAVHQGVPAEGNFLFDTGAQVSVLSEQLGLNIQLDSNQDGVLDNNDAYFARWETVGGVGGTITAPVFLFDEVHIPAVRSEDGLEVDLVWTDVQWLVLDIWTGVEPVVVNIADPGGTPVAEDNVPDPADTPGVQINVTDSSTRVVENGATDTYDVVLTSTPADDVVVTVRPDEELQANPSTLTFTPENWDQAQTVTVTAVNDGDPEGAHYGYIKHWVRSEDPAYQLGIDAVFGHDLVTSGWIEAWGIPGQSGWNMQVQLDFRDWEATEQGEIHFDVNPILDNVIDPNGPGAEIIESGDSTTVSEGQLGDPWYHEDTYQIRLTQQPTGNVRVNLSTPGGEVEAVEQISGQAYVDFTSTTWNIWQTVVVSAVDDGDVEYFHRSSVFHNVDADASDAPAYEADGVGMPRVITNIIDDDSVGVMIIPTGGSTDVVENGAPDTYEVVLTGSPSAGTYVSVTLENTPGQVTAVNANAPSESVLTFTDANWSDRQTVQVTAVDDDYAEGPHHTFVGHIPNTDDPALIDTLTSTLLLYVLPERVSITDDDGPPTVTNVWVRGSNWDSDFLAHLGTLGVGGTNGYAIPVGSAEQLDPLPWLNIDTIAIEFSEDVTVAKDNLELWGATVAKYGFASDPDGFSYDAATHLATWRLDQEIDEPDKLLIDLGGVTGAAGIALDGEWTDSTSSYPSGDGAAGGEFTFRFNVLPGDADQSEWVLTADWRQIRDKLLKQPGEAEYSIFSDVDGSAWILTADWRAARNRLLDQLPADDPAPAGDAMMPIGSSVGELEPTALAQSAVAPANTRESMSWIIRSLACINPPSESLLGAAELHPGIVPADPPPDPDPADDVDAGWEDPPDDWTDWDIGTIDGAQDTDPAGGDAGEFEAIPEPTDPRGFSDVEALMAEALWAYEFDDELADSETDDPHAESAVDDFFTSYYFSLYFVE